MTTALQKKLNQKARAIGPVYTGTMVALDLEDDRGGKHSIQFFPDKNNPELRAAGLPQHYYYLPAKPRLQTHSNGHFMFHCQKFSGVMDPTKNIGEDGFSELAGGVLSFTSTMAPPEGVLEKAKEALKEELIGNSDDHYRLKEEFRISHMPLKSNKTVLHSLKFGNSPESAEGETSDNPDAWAFEIQGDGAGTLNIHGSNAFTAMLGRRPITLLLGSAKSGTSQVTLENHLTYDVWALASKIEITGEWEKVSEHFSQQASLSTPFVNVNAANEVNKMIDNGAISVKIEYGAGVTTQRKEDIEKSADLIADKIIALVDEKLKEAGSLKDEDKAKMPNNPRTWFSWASAAVAINRRKDIFTGKIEYTKEINEQIVRSDMISAQMEGVFEAASHSEDAMAIYFSEVFMEEAFNKVHVVVNANANWPDEAGNGDPIHSMKVQIGYPDSKGSIVWKPAARFKDGTTEGGLSKAAAAAIWTPTTKDRLYVFDFTRHDQDGENEDEKIYIRKTISFKESPDVAINEIVEEYSASEHLVEVRAESNGQLKVGPIGLNMPLSPEDKQVSVLVRVKTDTFGEKSYKFTGENLKKPHIYNVWYASPDDVEPYQYKCEVTVKGKRFGQSSLNWESDWVTETSTGDTTFHIPEVPKDMQAKLDTYLS